jgi:Tol biopolymer transport system component
LTLGAGTDAIGYNSPVIAISPDGAWLVYVAKTPLRRMLYLRDLSAGEVRPLAETEDAIYPFFSPDGQWAGFLTIDQVKKISIRGGAVISLCEADSPKLASWTKTGQIFFTEGETYSISRVSADGVKPERVVSCSDVKVTRFNDVLPDGQTGIRDFRGSVRSKL